MKQSLWKKILMDILAGIFSAVIVWILTQIVFESFFYRIEAQTYDWRMRRAVQGVENPIEEIVIIDVDERSVQQLGSYHHWPRTYWERLITYLDESGVSMIGTDFIFDPDPQNPREDRAFQLAMFQSEKVCGALYFSQADPEHFRPQMSSEPEGLDYRRLIHQLPEELFQNLISQERLEPSEPGFINACATAGSVNLFPDPDGVLRRIPLFLRFNQHAYGAFALQMAIYMKNLQNIEYEAGASQIILSNEDGNQIEIPTDKYGQMLIHYVGGFKSFRYISFYDALMGFVPDAYFQDKVVLIGSSLPGLYDLRSTPLQAAFPGVEVNANVLYQLLNNRFIYQFSDFQKLLFVVIIGLIAGLILIIPRPLGSIVITGIIIFIIFVVGVYAMEYYWYWIPTIAPVFTVIFVFATTYVYRYLFEEKNKRQIKKLFSHYVSSSVVDDLLKNPEKVKLGGEKKFCSVLFSDVVGFTTISEQLDPESLVNILNEYLTEMTRIIFNNQGLLDKYEGDAIMAVYGAPVEMKEHAELCCASAIQMQKKLAEMRKNWKKFNKPELRARVGINSGEMVVGNMGSETRFDYTVMGDSVNLAARLEGANKLYDTEIMIGENTYELVKDQFIARPLDLLRVKGKKRPVKVFELIADREENLPTDLKEMLVHYKKGFENYLLGNWRWAINHFRQAIQVKQDDGPSRIYLLRCQEFLNHPPGKDWDGVFVMKSK